MYEFQISLTSDTPDVPNSPARFLTVSFGREHQSKFVLDIMSVGGGDPTGTELQLSTDYGVTGAALMSVPAALVTDEKQREAAQISDASEFFALFQLMQAKKDTRTPEEVMVEYDEIVSGLKDDGRAKAMAPIAHAWLRHFQFRATTMQDYPDLPMPAVVCFGYALNDEGKAITVDLVHFVMSEDSEEPFSCVISGENSEIRGELLIEQLASFSDDYYEKYRRMRPETYAFLQSSGVIPANITFEQYMESYGQSTTEQTDIRSEPSTPGAELPTPEQPNANPVTH